MAAETNKKTIDVVDLIDRHPVTPFQIVILILCMLVAALDGFDTQAIGYTAPAIAAVIHLPMPQFGQVGSAGLIGAAIGALSFGPLADVFGRKWFMIIAVLIFAVFSYLTAQSGSLNELLAYRLCAGLGLGGVTPAFLAMGAELAPKRLALQRAERVSLVAGPVVDRLATLARPLVWLSSMRAVIRL